MTRHNSSTSSSFSASPNLIVSQAKLYRNPFRYNFTDIQSSAFLTDNVSAILETRIVGNLARYLEFQGYTYIKKDFEGFSKSALNQIYEAKRLFFEEKSRVISNFTALENNSSLRRRSAQAEQTFNNESLVDFRTLDLQSNSPGLLAVGFEYNWCTDNEVVIAKIKFSSTTQYDIACITSPDGQIYVSSFNKYGFSESYRIDNSYSILNGSNATNIPSEYSDIDFRLSYFFGDFNGDGKDEIGLSHTASQNFTGGIRIYNQESPGIWISRTGSNKKDFCVEARLVCSIQECGVRTGDFNADGKDDLWCHNKYTGVNEVIFNNATGLIYRWYVPNNFDLNHRLWCKEGYLQIADFNGDGKSDAVCLHSDNEVSVLYSLGDGSFVSKTGLSDGNLNLGAKLQGWSFDLQSNVTFFRPPNFVAADFDADGYGDLWGIADNSRLSFDFGINRFLFGNSFDSVTSRTSDISGIVVFGQDLFSWCTSGIIFSADINGDNKDDLFCNANDNNYFRMSFVNSSNVETGSIKLKITVSNYTFGAFSVSEDQFKSSVQDVKCNNKVRPDDKLGCQASVFNSIQTIKNIKIDTPWARSTSFAYIQPVIEMLYLGDGNISYTPDNSDTKTQKLYINYANGIDLYTNTIQSSLSTLVRSGVGIQFSMATSYISGVSIPYNATAYLTAFAGAQVLTGNELLLVARNALINVVPTLNADGTEVSFEIYGSIEADLMLGTNNVAVNNNNFYIPTSTRVNVNTPTFTRTAPSFPSFTAPPHELSVLTPEPELNFTTSAVTSLPSKTFTSASLKQPASDSETFTYSDRITETYSTSATTVSDSTSESLTASRLTISITDSISDTTSLSTSKPTGTETITYSSSDIPSTSLTKTPSAISRSSSNSLSSSASSTSSYSEAKSVSLSESSSETPSSLRSQSAASSGSITHTHTTTITHPSTETQTKSPPDTGTSTISKTATSPQSHSISNSASSSSSAYSTSSSSKTKSGTSSESALRSNSAALSHSITSTSTITATPPYIKTQTKSSTTTDTSTISKTSTSTITPSHSISTSASSSASAYSTSSETKSPSITLSVSQSASTSSIRSRSASITSTPTKTTTYSSTKTGTKFASDTSTGSTSVTITPTNTQSNSVSKTATDTSSTTPTATNTPTRISTATKSSTQIRTATRTTSVSQTSSELLYCLTIIGPTNSQFGASVFLGGDFNGDGNGDIIIGAPGYNNNSGAVFIVYLTKHMGGFFNVRNLNGVNGLVIAGATASQFGISVSCGDINKDGLIDCVIGAPTRAFLTNSSIKAGAAYGVFGTSATLPASFTADSLTSTSTPRGFKMYNSNSAVESYGKNVAVGGDINEDGFADFAIGSPGQYSNYGSVSVVAGQAIFPDNITALNTTSNPKGVIIAGNALFSPLPASYFGSAVAIGNFGGSSKNADLLIGAFGGNINPDAIYPQGNGGSGILCGIYGSNTSFSSVQSPTAMNISSYGFYTLGSAFNTYLGGVVTVGGDMNGDGINDYAAGARGTTTNATTMHSGLDYLGFVIPTATSGFFGGSNSSQSVQLIGQAQSAGSVLSISALSIGGSINADKYADLAVGMQYFSNSSSLTNNGAVSFVYGHSGTLVFPTQLNVSQLNSTQGVMLYGQHANDLFGSAISIGADFDGDGNNDTAIGVAGANMVNVYCHH